MSYTIKKTKVTALILALVLAVSGLTLMPLSADAASKVPKIAKSSMTCTLNPYGWFVDEVKVANIPSGTTLNVSNTNPKIVKAKLKGNVLELTATGNGAGTAKIKVGSSNVLTYKVTKGKTTKNVSIKNGTTMSVGLLFAKLYPLDIEADYEGTPTPISDDIKKVTVSNKSVIKVSTTVLKALKTGKSTVKFESDLFVYTVIFTIK